MTTHSKTLRSHILDTIFLIGLLGKGLAGFFEFIIGIALVFLSPENLTHIVDRITARELLEDPNDFIANLLVHGASHVNKHFLIFGAIYLIIHGVVKLAVFVALLLGAVKVYPWAIGALVLMTLYQIGEMFIHPSIGLLLLTLFDVAIIALTWREWREKRTVWETLADTRAWMSSWRKKRSD